MQVEALRSDLMQARMPHRAHAPRISLPTSAGRGRGSNKVPFSGGQAGYDRAGLGQRCEELSVAVDRGEALFERMQYSGIAMLPGT